MTFDEFKSGTGVTAPQGTAPSATVAPTTKAPTKGMSFDDFKTNFAVPTIEQADPRNSLQSPAPTQGADPLHNAWDFLKNSMHPYEDALKTVGGVTLNAGKEIVKTVAAKPFVSLISGIKGLAGMEGGNQAMDVPGLGKVEPYRDISLSPTKQLISTSGDVLNAASLLPLGAAAKAGQATIETQAPKIAEELTSAGVSKSVIEKLFTHLQEAPDKIGNAISAGLKSSAYADMTIALGATTKEMRAISERVVPELVDRGVIAFTRKGLLSKAETAAETAGQAVEDTISTMPQMEHPTSSILRDLRASRGELFDTTTNLSPSEFAPYKAKLDAAEEQLHDLVKYKDEYNVSPQAEFKGTGKRPAFANLDEEIAKQQTVVDSLANKTYSKRIPLDAEKIKNYDEIIGTIKKYGKDISDESLIKLRRLWDSDVARGKGFMGKTLAEGSRLDIKKEATTAIRKVLASAHPELAKVNAEYSFWKNVEKVIGATVEKSANKAPSMSEQVITGVGAAGGLSHGAPLEGAAIAKGAFKLVKSAAWKTLSAAVKNKFADAIVSGNAKYINAAITKYLGHEAEKLSE